MIGAEGGESLETVIRPLYKGPQMSNQDTLLKM